MDTPEPSADTLPRRTPAPPDVPEIPGVGLDDEPETDRGPAALARIAAGLRVDEPETAPPGDGFDFDAVVDAVREVSGVRDAKIKRNASGVHTLRLDLYDDADGARVSREVARLLKEKMGLAAEPRRSSPGSAPVAPALAASNGISTGAITTSGEYPPSGASTPVQPANGVPGPALPGPAVPGPAMSGGGMSGGGMPGSGFAGTSSGLPGFAAPSYPSGGDTYPREAPRHPAAAPRTRGSVDGRPHPGSEEVPPQLRRQARPGELPRVVLDEVQVRTLGIDATVEVRLNATGRGPVVGVAHGPSVDGYVLRLAAVATASAVDQLLRGSSMGEAGRCYVEHAAVVPLGSCELAVVVVFLMVGGWVQQLSGSALSNGDPRQAIVRATLDAINRRVDALLG
ncbi:MAG TPA: hypothetical protein VHA75_18500 [Rugosimonospora sp.]|nr:hypothetical protein [Rugosimonospora sp.]